MHIGHTATVGGITIPGDETKTVYEVEATGYVNLGCSAGGDVYHGFYPSEKPSADVISLKVLEAIDYRFGNEGVPLNLVDSRVTGERAGKWLLNRLKEEEALGKIEQALIESLCRSMDDMASLRA